MTQLVVRISDDQQRVLALLAHQKRQRISDVVRDALTNHLQRQKEHNVNELLALAEIGKRFKGKKYPKNLSTNYKRYLYGDKRI